MFFIQLCETQTARFLRFCSKVCSFLSSSISDGHLIVHNIHISDSVHIMGVCGTERLWKRGISDAVQMMNVWTLKMCLFLRDCSHEDPLSLWISL